MAAAAYAALVSLTNTIHLICNHPTHSSSFDLNQIASLREYARSFLEFAESYDSHGRSKEMEDLETQMASAACMAEDILESHVSDQIYARLKRPNSNFLKTKMKSIKAKVMKAPKELRSKVDADYRERKRERRVLENRPSYWFHLQEILEDRMCSIMEKAGKLIVEDLMAAAAAAAPSSSSSSSTPLTTGKTAAAMVGFDGYSFQLMDVLTGQQSARQIVSVVGMGGSGKTTLARNVYENLVIVQHFDVRAWATISQQFNAKEILSQLLSGLGKFSDGEVGQLGEQLHKKLSGRRYLIMLDNMWSGEFWDSIRSYFPDNGNGSRVVVTTRLSSVASYFTTSSLEMKLLDGDKSWELFCAKTFGEEEDCPLELVDIGKKIVKQCKGLPLPIVVIGGHLKKCSRTREQWAEVARNMILFMNSGEEQCLSILGLSYSHLPAYLKPCFLYMGFFREDEEILVSTLVRLWIAEGFLRLDGDRSLEEVAEGCLKDLVDRNLISVGKKGWNGKVLTCNVHDLLRELCLKVGEKEKFSCVVKHPAAAASRCSWGCPICNVGRFSIHEYKLLRIMRKPREKLNDVVANHFPSATSRYFNLRNIFIRLSDYGFNSYHDMLIGISLNRKRDLKVPWFISLHWNLQTLVIERLYGRLIAPVEIWKMPQLRHVNISDVISLPDPPPPDKDDSVMPNLKTLSVVENFQLVEEVSRRIPNIEELRLRYVFEASSSLSSDSEYYHQYNLGRFNKLESLELKFDKKSNRRSFALSIKFPGSLREIRLESSGLRWEDLSMIGTLPNLQVLKLTGKKSVKGSRWNSVEGEFLSLKSLTIEYCDDLVCWNGERSHFPVMESLILKHTYKLAEFPSDIGEIPTLMRVRLYQCSVGAAISAVKMLVEQEELENDDLRLEIRLERKKDLESVVKMMEEEGIEKSKNLRLDSDYY